MFLETKTLQLVGGLPLNNSSHKKTQTNTNSNRSLYHAHELRGCCAAPAAPTLSEWMDGDPEPDLAYGAVHVRVPRHALQHAGDRLGDVHHGAVAAARRAANRTKQVSISINRQSSQIKNKYRMYLY